MILGYGQDAMEPFISRDGSILFFNNSNDPNVDTDLFWARRVDDLTFEFQGPVDGANSSALDAVASMDRDNNLYLVSTRSYFSTLSTIYRGRFSDGELTGLEIVPGVSRKKAGVVDFDDEISADGNTLYFSEGTFGQGGPPRTAIIRFARKNGSAFVPDPASAKVFARINTKTLNYAACISASELEFFFTRLTPTGPAIFAARRKSTSKPFGKPKRIKAITGFAEAPTITSDGNTLYFHKRDGNRFFIYQVTR